jgi:quercetin 2,3-dioxygenase
METRRVRKVSAARPTLEGAGVALQRAIGFGAPQTYDPFLLLDDFRSDSPDDYLAGFPWHPHRGMETVTYVLRGTVEHRDSLGNQGTISAGDVQWMSAGSGIIHQEMPKGDASGAMYGFQLWANLPAANKMMDPRYQEIRAKDIPEVKDQGGATVRVIAGTVGNVTGPVREVVTQPQYLDVSLPPKTTFTHPIPRGHTVIAYVFSGKGIFCLVSGQPIREPIAWRGPIVMNTQAELRLAFEELDTNTFIKHAKRAR